MKSEGILLINKQKNKTSFSIVSILRKLTKIKKIGHAGTLDPFARGVMIMLIGKNYTKKSNLFTSLNKTYLAKIVLGKKTLSFDSESPPFLFSDKVPSLDEIENVISKFQGKISQIPPMYSAKKIKGQKLYNLARKGISIKREPIEVDVEIEILHYCYPFLDLKVKCSKGTYIRTLADDIGEKLKCYGYLKELTRTSIGSFHLKECVDQEILYSENFKVDTFLRDF
jgi:tRNA pseudouridine55 synthase